PKVTGTYGGRQVVVPLSAIEAPVAAATTATVLTVSSFPCSGPIVAVVNRLASSAPSKPSATAARRSLADTSSLKSTNPFVRPALPAPARPPVTRTSSGSREASGKNLAARGL